MGSTKAISGYARIVILLAQFLIATQLAASCAEQEFKCNSSKCIPVHLKCNDEDDCGDSSDEINCTDRNKCDEGEFACIDGICISSSLVCNGRMDCPRGLDEMNCATSHPEPSTSTTKLEGILRTADGQSIIPFPVTQSSPAFRVYLRFTAHRCIGHLLEMTSQNTDQFFLLSLTNNGNLHLFFKTALGPGLITVPPSRGDSFCNGKIHLLTVKRNLAEVAFRVNRGRRYVTRNVFLREPFQSMNKVNVGFGLEGCVSGVDMLYYSSKTKSQSVGVSKGCVFAKKTTRIPTISRSSVKPHSLPTDPMITNTRSRVRKESEQRTRRYSTRSPSLVATEPTPVTHSTVTQAINNAVTQTVTLSVTQTNQDTNTAKIHVTDDQVTDDDTKPSSTMKTTEEIVTDLTKEEQTTTYQPSTEGIQHRASLQPTPVINETSKPSTLPGNRCKPLPPMCAGLGLRQSYRISKETQNAERQMRRFLPFIRANCSTFLRAFLCASYFPSCSPSQSVATQLCRELCLKTKHECSSLMDAFEFKWPEALDCESLPNQNREECLMPPTLGSMTTQTTQTKATLTEETVGPTRARKRRCGGIFRKPLGLISSPNYPHPYPPDTVCQWTIVLPRIYRVINLLIEDASLEADNKCGYDYIRFQDGLSNQVGSKVCGFLEYPRLVSIKGNIAKVVFRSDSALNKKGFLIKYEAHSYP